MTEADLLAAVVGPELDSLTAQTTLKMLREQCLFLHFDGTRYVFKTTPNVTQLLEQEADNVEGEIGKEIEEELGRRLAGRSAFVWPKSSAVVDDLVPQFTLIYLPLDFASWGEIRQEAYALDLLLKHGDQPRRFRNGLGLAVPNWQQIEVLRHAAKYVLAVARLRTKRSQHNLTTEQMAQLKEREQTEQSKAESAYRDLYNAVWLPLAVDGRIGLEKVDIGARPLSATSLHERLMELLMDAQRKVHSTLLPHKLVELMRLGEAPSIGGARLLGLRASQVRDAFFENLGFPRLEKENALRQAIIKGVKDGHFGYVGRADRIQPDRVREGSSYLIPQTQAVFESGLLLDEIDLDNGFIVLPEALEPKALLDQPALDITTPTTTPILGSTPTVPNNASPGIGPAPSRTRITLRMRLTRPQLYQTFNALANLADKAGAIEVSVSADSMQGFDPVWLRNAVQEPLDEAGIDMSEE